MSETARAFAPQRHSLTRGLKRSPGSSSGIAVTNNSSQRQDKDGPSPGLEHVLRNFVACDRCSFFLAGYQVIHGRDNLDAAVENRTERWLSLSWNEETRRLVQTSYGGRLDVDLYYYDGQCPACRRRFTYQVAKEGEQPELRIELK